MDIILPTRFNNPNLPIVQRPGFADDFDRPSANTLGTTDDGKEWTLLDIGSNASVWGPNGDGTASLKTASSSYQAVVADGLAADGTLTAQVATVGANDERWGGLAIRALDESNYIYISETASADQRIMLRERVDGSSNNLAGPAAALQSGDVLDVTVNGTAIEVFLNGTSILTATSSNFIGETRHGFYAASGTVSSWESIEFTPA